MIPRHSVPTLLYITLLFTATSLCGFSTFDGIVAPSPMESPLLKAIQDVAPVRPLYVPTLADETQPAMVAIDPYRAQAWNRTAMGLSVSASSQQATRKFDAERYRIQPVPRQSTMGPLEYGVTSQSNGDNIQADTQANRQRAWVGWHGTAMGLNSSLVQDSNGVIHDPVHPRTTALQKRFGLDLTVPDWPALTVTYTQQDANAVLDGIGVLSRSQREAVESAVTYQFTKMQVQAGTKYATTTQSAQASGTSAEVQHMVSGSYSPQSTVTLGSRATLTDVRNQGSGQRTETPSAQLTMAYHPSDTVNLSLLSSYSRMQDNLGTVDIRTMNAKSTLSWQAARTASSATTVSLETGYSSSTDLLHPDRLPDNLSAIFRVTLSGTSWLDALHH
jgi:hypothetical protein